MIKVIKNGTVITMDKNKKQYENLDIVIKDDLIIEVSDNYNGFYDELIDASNKIVMPGLINCHTHLGMSIFRATNDNLTLNDWLNNKIWPIENNMNDEDVYYSTLLSCIEMIRTGTTTSNDMYFNSEGSIKAIIETKVRSLFSRCLMDKDSNGDKRIEEFLELYNKYNNNKLIKFTVSPHSFYTCSKDYLKKCSDLAFDLNIPLHIHFSENIDEVNKINLDYNLDPVDVLEEVGFFKNKLILAHSTFINEQKLDKLKDKEISFIHNPISNLNLGCGIADIVKYKKYVNIALGTDGVGSGNNMNLFYHMSVVDLLQKGIYKDPTVFSSFEVLKMATINGAKALGIENITGSIEVGKKADIIIVDLNDYPTPDLITNLVHNTESSNIDCTIINGEILMKNHKLCLDINEEEVLKKIDEINKRLNI